MTDLTFTKKQTRTGDGPHWRSQVTHSSRTPTWISGLLSHGRVRAAEQAASLRSAHPAGRGRGFGVYPAPARLSTRNCPTLGLPGSAGPASARPSHVRVLGAGHNVWLELGVVEGRGGADKPPVLLAAGVDLELRQAAGQLVACQSAPHLRAGRRGGQGVWAVWGPGARRAGSCAARPPCGRRAPAAGSDAPAGRRIRRPAARSWLGAHGAGGRTSLESRGPGRGRAAPRKQTPPDPGSALPGGGGMAAARGLGLRAAGLGSLLRAAGMGPVSGAGWPGWGRAPGLNELSRPLASPQAPARAVRRSALGVISRPGEDSSRDALGIWESRPVRPCLRFAGARGITISPGTAARASESGPGCARALAGAVVRAAARDVP